MMASTNIVWNMFQRLNPGDPFCSIYNEITSTVTTNNLKGSEPAYVDNVAVDVKSNEPIRKVSL